MFLRYLSNANSKFEISFVEDISVAVKLTDWAGKKVVDWKIATCHSSIISRMRVCAYYKTITIYSLWHKKASEGEKYVVVQKSKGFRGFSLKIPEFHAGKRIKRKLK